MCIISSCMYIQHILKKSYTCTKDEMHTFYVQYTNKNARKNSSIDKFTQNSVFHFHVIQVLQITHWNRQVFPRARQFPSSVIGVSTLHKSTIDRFCCIKMFGFILSVRLANPTFSYPLERKCCRNPVREFSKNMCTGPNWFF